MTIIYTLVLWVLTIFFLIKVIVRSSDNELRVGFGIMLFVEALLIIMFCAVLNGYFGGGFIAYVFHIILALLQTFVLIVAFAIYLHRKFIN
jgi:hypothetical protein